MSTGIHMHLEAKLDDIWYHYSQPSILKECHFFELLAGIYDGNPIVQLRGIPDDISFMTRYCLDRDKECFKPHHEGWIGADEIWELQKRLIEVHKRYNIYDPLGSDLEASYFHCYMDGGSIASHRGFDDVRLIFWFDN